MVCTKNEVRQIIGLMDGVPQLIVKLMYGCGLRVMEPVRLRVQGINYDMYQQDTRKPEQNCRTFKMKYEKITINIGHEIPFGLRL